MIFYNDPTPYRFGYQCEKCHNNYFDNIRLYKAEKGTIIQLFDRQDGTDDDDYASIEILKSFDYKDKNSNPLIYENEGIYIQGYESSKTDNEYYKMTFFRHKSGKGNLDRKVSNVGVIFPNMLPNGVKEMQYMLSAAKKPLKRCYNCFVVAILKCRKIFEFQC